MIFLYGMKSINAGPANVNKSLIENSNGKIVGVRFQKKCLRLAEGIFKILCADTVLISSLMSMSVFMTKFAKTVGKKVIYIKHGDAKYERDVNRSPNMNHMIDCECLIMEYCDLILCVSELYMRWSKEQYPEFAHKMSFVNNGVNFVFRKKKQKKPGSIAVAGGNRRVKNNYEIYQAVEYLNKHTDQKYTLYVYGREYQEGLPFLNNPNVVYMGQMEKEEYYAALDEMELFVVNSSLESFGLVVADALNTNCSLLLSRNIGAASILELEDEDYIEDSYNIEGIAKEIEWIMEHPNVKRLQQGVNIYKTSEEYAAKKLIGICNDNTV